MIEADNLKIDDLKEIEDEEEIEDNDDSLADLTEPFRTQDIKISSAVLSLSSIINRLQHNEIDLNPDFQRNADLWNYQKMSRLIESIILRLPLPIFYFDVSNPEKWIVIDGLQRLSAIKKYIVDKKMKLKHLEFLKDLENKTYDDLDRPIQRVIEETQIHTYQIEPQTPKEVKYSIFNRINTGGMTLNAQEVRQALNQSGVGVEFLRTVAEDNYFKNIVRIKSKRMVDRELILRFIALYKNDFRNYIAGTKTMSTLLDETMEAIDKENDISKLNIYKVKLTESLNTLDNLFAKDTLFNKKLNDPTKTRTLNRSLFEIWTVLLSKLSENQRQILIQNKDSLTHKYIELLKDSDFDASITKGTNDKKAVGTRFNALEKLLNEVLNEN